MTASITGTSTRRVQDLLKALGCETGVSKSTVSRIGEDIEREVLGADVSGSEGEVLWAAFLTSLKDRGLSGVNLVISDAHRGLQAAIRKTVQGSALQRCKVYLARKMLPHVPRGQAEMVAAFVRTIFANAFC